MGIVILIPITILAFCPFVSEFQTRLLSKHSGLSGLQIQNILADEGSIQIATSMGDDHSNLQYVDMGTNHIRRAGAVALAHAVINKESFKLLNLDGNIISEEGIEEVKEIFKNSPELLGSFEDNDPDGDEEDDDEEEEED